jgi:ABC-type transport system substrate-binding protein
MRELVMLSKDQWDAEGLDGYTRQLIGTGPYELVERDASLGLVLYERVENHWRHTPDFPELVFFHTLEDATRMAQLLTDEAHIAPVSADLQAEVQRRGMKVISSTKPGQQASFLIGGLYYSQPGNFDLNDKLTDVRVRKAMNLAVNRDEIIDSLFLGRAEKLIVQGWHRDLLPGYDLQWDADFEEAYGFNPTLASQLVREAGAEGFEFEILQYPRPGMPEWVDIAESLALYWEAIGLSPKLRQVDQAFISAPLRAYEMHGMLWPNNTGLVTQPVMIWFWNYSPDGAGGRSFQNARIDELYPQLAQSVDLAERETISREVGTILFDSYPNIPLVWVYSQMVINPNVVSEYAFPGIISGLYTHFEYVEAAQ